MTTRRIVVAEPGAMTTVQDAGRPGLAHLGVPRSGALDPGAAALANRLVGNADGAAVLETMLAGLSFTVSTAMTVAVTGALAPVLVNGSPKAFADAVSVRAGALVRLGRVQEGLRCYVALSGGVEVPAVLGSRSTDTLAGIGPAPLHAGDEIPVGEPMGPPSGVDLPVTRRVHARVVLRVAPGPRDDWFTRGALTTLTGSTYAVSTDSNRIGLRLNGPPLARRRTKELPSELPSEGIVLGAVQVPASGEPLVFLNDHPTTGGYPVIAVVAPADLALCAQLCPGDEVRFTRA